LHNKSSIGGKLKEEDRGRGGAGSPKREEMSNSLKILYEELEKIKKEEDAIE
jgi:hypothetical protein